MAVPYEQIIADARQKHVPNYFSVGVEFESNGVVKFRVAWCQNQGDEMVHLHNVKNKTLDEVIDECRRRCDWESGRRDDLVMGVDGRGNFVKVPYENIIKTTVDRS